MPQCKKYHYQYQPSIIIYTITKVNYLEVSSSLLFIEVIDFNGITYVGELYTFLYLNVIKYCGVSTNQRLSYVSFTFAMFSRNGITYLGILI